MNPTAVDVARYLLHLNNEGGDPDLISHLQLQKLLYYCQGWSLGMRDEPLFADPIEAWVHGPVSPNVYKVFANYGDDSLPRSEGEDTGALSERQKVFIQPVWDHYRRFSATELRRKTHEEPPWLKARGDIPPDRRCDTVISHDAMRAYFGEQRRFIADRLQRANDDFMRGNVVPLEALVAELK